MTNTYVVQDATTFSGREVEIWSDGHSWAYAYGVVLGGHLRVETFVCGFENEDMARDAAAQHCYESALEASMEAHEV